MLLLELQSVVVVVGGVFRAYLAANSSVLRIKKNKKKLVAFSPKSSFLFLFLLSQMALNNLLH